MRPSGGAVPDPRRGTADVLWALTAMIALTPQYTGVPHHTIDFSIYIDATTGAVVAVA